MYVSIDVYPTQTSLPNNILPELTYMIPFSDLYMCIVKADTTLSIGMRVYTLLTWQPSF